MSAGTSIGVVPFSPGISPNHLIYIFIFFSQLTQQSEVLTCSVSEINNVLQRQWVSLGAAKHMAVLLE